MRSTHIESAIQAVARELANQDGWLADGGLTIAPGITCPIWVAYLDTAEQLVSNEGAIKRANRACASVMPDAGKLGEKV